MPKLTLATIGDIASATATINANSALITAALEKTLSRDGTEPNSMDDILDMNDNRIINLPAPATDSEPVRRGDIVTAPEVDERYAEIVVLRDETEVLKEDAEAAASTASTDASEAAASALAADASADAAAASAAMLAGIEDSLDIVRSEISTVTISVDSFWVAGETTRGDHGAGALYIRGTSGGLRAVQDAGGTWWNLAIPNNIANVGWFGAKGDGTTDDTAAFTAAIAAARTVLCPKTYKTTGVITLSSVGGLASVLDGMETGIISITSTTAPAVALTGGIAGYLVKDLKITRVGTPVAGAFGIYVGAAGVLGTTDRSMIKNVKLTNHWHGLALSSTDYSEVVDCVVEACYSHGIYMTNTSTYGPAQWHLRNILVQTCAGTGFHFQATNGPAGTILGEWVGLKTFANTGGGIKIIGTATCGVNDTRILGGFIGGDNTDELYMDTYGNNHLIQNCFFEYSGASGTGPGMATPASNNGSGINITANNNSILITGIKIMLCAEHGIVSAAPNLVFTGNLVSTNNRAGKSGGRHGIYILAGSAIVSGNFSGNIGASFQSYGFVTSVDAVAVTGNDFRSNASGYVFYSGTPTVSTYMSNLPRAVNIP